MEYDIGCVGDMVDKKYSLMSLIGIGQQGEVYKVKSGLVEYAMKVIRHHKKTNINEILDIYRIASDAEIGPRVYDMGHCTTQKNVRYSYIIMDLIEPTSLPIRGELNLQLFLNTLSLYWKLFLNHGIQHNDYKPDNFMLHGGRLYLIDYDSAFKTQVTSYTIKKYYRSTTIGHYIRRYSNYQELDKLYDKYWKYIKEQYRKFIEHSIALSLSSGKVPIDLVETFDNNKVNHIAILDHPSDGERPKFSCREGVYIRLYEWDGYPKPTVYLTRQELKEFLLRSVRDCNLVYPSFRRILIRTDNNHVYEHTLGTFRYTQTI